MDVYAVGNVGFDLMHQVDKKADLILSNARVLTFSPDTKCWSPGTLEISRDRSEVPSGIRFMPGFVAVKGNRILGVGEMGEAHLFEGPDTKEIDCRGMALAPGFNDAHCHLLALASSLRGVDCRPDKVRSITQIVSAINRRAESTPPSTFPESQNHGRECTSHGAPWGLSGKRWIRAFGYDEFYLAEGRHPTRWDLDRASAFHPIRLDHRTGHASVLNSRALDLLDISRATPDPSDGVIERDEATGEPTGVLFGMASYIREVTEPRRDEEETLEGVRRANEMILSKGITSIQDASPANDLLRWESFKRLKEEGHLTPRVTMMVGASHLHSCLDVGLTPGSGDDGLRVGAVKLVLSLVTGALQPHLEELNEIVLRAHERGFQIAIHAVEEEAVEAVAEALIKVQAALPLPNVRHRIEHCSECPPRVLEKVRGSQALVVTQPSFIYHNGEKYLSLVEEGLLPHLYPVASLLEAGVPVAASSDAPVTYPDPLLSIYSAVTRRIRGGKALFSDQGVSAWEALRMHSINGAYASFDEERKGSITVGKLADLTLLDEDPTALESEGIREVNVMLTMVGGEVVWQR